MVVGMILQSLFCSCCTLKSGLFFYLANESFRCAMTAIENSHISLFLNLSCYSAFTGKAGELRTTRYR